MPTKTDISSSCSAGALSYHATFKGCTKKYTGCLKESKQSGIPNISKENSDLRL